MFRPPTPMPTSTRRIASSTQPLSGVSTQARVNTVNSSTHQKKDALRPILSASRPHRMAPSTVPRPDIARMMPASKPCSVQLGSFSRLLTANPIRNMSKNSEMLPTTASEMRFF